MNKPQTPVVFIILLIGTLLVTFSCRKATQSAPTSIPIIGTWVGTQSVVDATIRTPISFVIKSDNTFDYFTDGRLNSGVGNWQLTDNIFTASYVFRSDPTAVYEYTATYDSKTAILSPGTWYIRGATIRGTWAMLRQKIT
jgi:hypothetical protein